MTAAGSPSPEVAVIILTMNQRETTLRCLASFRDVRSSRYKIVVWDNGSEDGTVEAVRRDFPNVVVHRNAANLGAAGGRNAASTLAIDTFDPAYLLFLDNDTVVTPDFLDELVRPFAQDARVGQTHPKIRLFDEPERLDGVGAEIRLWLADARGIGYGEIDSGQYDEPAACLAGGCFVVPTSMFRKLEGFDVQFDPYGLEDIDFSLRVQKAGYSTVIIPQSVIFHESSRTPFAEKSYSANYVKLKARNWFRFVRKHASPGQQAALLFLGIPYLAARAVVREGRRGNLRALLGVFGSMASFWRSRAQVK